MLNFQTALITGGNGNLGSLVAQQLSKKGVELTCFDLPGTACNENSGYSASYFGDIRDQARLQQIIGKTQPQAILHLASLLSGSSEADLQIAWEINATASINLMQIAMRCDVEQFFFPSSIATYGPNVADPTPEDFPQWPENMYGVTKIAVEKYGTYLKQAYGFDFRCLRFPQVLSPFAPVTAKTAYPSHSCRAAAADEPYHFPVSAETGMSCMYLDDVIRSIVEISETPKDWLKRPAYNLHGFHFTARQLAAKLAQAYPTFNYSFEIDLATERLIAGWPNEMIAGAAQVDWGWAPAFDFDSSVTEMLGVISLDGGA